MARDVELSGLPLSLVLEPVEKDRVNWLSRFAAFALADGVVTSDERDYFEAAEARMYVIHELVKEPASRLQRVFMFSEARAGRIRTLDPGDLHLPLDERLHLDVSAARWRQLKSGPQSTQGRLIFTNKTVTFAAASHGGQAPWSKIVRVTPTRADSLVIEGSTARMAGTFSVSDAEWVAELAAALLSLDRRQVLAGGTGRSAIPNHVKGEVWRRDGGACRECGLDGSGGASLEFDHVIPVALGGATSVGNLQVLCRRCNGRKSARI